MVFVSGPAKVHQEPPVRHFQVLEDPCREEQGSEISKVRRLCPKGETSTRSCGLKPIGTGKIVEQREGVRQDPQDSTIPVPRFTRHHTTWTPLYHTGGTYSHNGMMDDP